MKFPHGEERGLRVSNREGPDASSSFETRPAAKYTQAA
jgi:hypothetical protein